MEGHTGSVSFGLGEAMTGQMMDYPLTLHHFLERAAKLYPNKEIVTRTAAGKHRYRYRDYHCRTHRLAHALQQLGIKPGDRVGTLCWNNHQHLELYFAVTCYGAVLHTLNLRLSPDDLAFIINHAEDRVIFVDESLVPILDKIRDRIPCVERCIVIGGGGSEYEQLLTGAMASPG
jgi:fatty-acyl-CoA synthase